MMKARCIRPLLVVALLTASCGGEAPKLKGPWAHVTKRKLSTPHASFFNKPFKSPQEVTKACLGCHPKAAKEIMKTSHWRWKAQEAVVLPGHKQAIRLGKDKGFNNFCIGTPSNTVMCTKCHIGYGWKDETFNFNDEKNVDCLVCHDTSGSYAKKGGGLPKKGVNLLKAARSVGHTSRGTCGNCHFYG
ncbi:MAG: cytochrome C, partial [Deltaproteobacteria bacterium]|nr:cytochrome C [Deltaproteobacteria bacterium]